MCYLNLICLFLSTRFITLKVGQGHSTHFYLNSLMFIIQPLHVYHGQKFTIVHMYNSTLFIQTPGKNLNFNFFLNTLVLC